jgi:hypothetical protein
MTLVPKRLINPKSTLVFLIVLLTLAIRLNSAPASGGSAAISVRFVGTGMPMGAAEVAGVIAKSNWNNEGWFSGTSTSVIDETGTVSGATVSWRPMDYTHCQLQISPETFG